MSLIYWIFVVDLNKLACAVVNLLINRTVTSRGQSLLHIEPSTPACPVHQSSIAAHQDGMGGLVVLLLAERAR